MARRKVTMLDAFKVSARESQERLLTERRRVAAEREKEARRDEASRSASEWGRRLGEGVGSWWSHLWGAEGRPSALEPRDSSAATRLPAGESTSSEVSQAGAEGSAPGSGSPSGASGAGSQATPIDRRPARVSSWESPQSTASVVADGTPGARVDSGEGSGESSGGGGGLDATRAALEKGAGESTDEPGVGAPLRGQVDLGEAPVERLSDPSARAAFDIDEFSLPMSGRLFSVLVAVALATVFGLGILLGGGSKGVDASEGEAAGAAGRAAEGRRAALSFADAQPRPPFSGGAVSADESAALDGVGGQLASRGLTSPQTAPAFPPAFPPGGAAAGVDPEEPTPADLAFLDPAMKYTVMALSLIHI